MNLTSTLSATGYEISQENEGWKPEIKSDWQDVITPVFVSPFNKLNEWIKPHFCPVLFWSYSKENRMLSRYVCSSTITNNSAWGDFIIFHFQSGGIIKKVQTSSFIIYFMFIILYHLLTLCIKFDLHNAKKNQQLYQDWDGFRVFFYTGLAAFCGWQTTALSFTFFCFIFNNFILYIRQVVLHSTLKPAGKWP